MRLCIAVFTITILILLAIALVLGGLVIRDQFRGIKDRLRALEVVTPGMTKEEVIIRLGEPSHITTDDPRIGPQPQILVYRSWGRTHRDILVILDKEGRVVTTVYPGYHSPLVGGIKIKRTAGHPADPQPVK